MGRLAYKSAVGFSAVTSVECIYIVGSQVGSQKSMWEVWKGDGEGSKQEIQTKGNCWCKLMPFLSDIDKFLLLFKQSKLFFWFCFLLLFSCCWENMSGI